MRSAAAHPHSIQRSKIELVATIAGAMAGTLMTTLDSTICNVALPFMQGSLQASRDQVTWILTSYIISTAVFTAPVGWFVARFGKRNVILTCLIGFTVTSVLCGMAQSLEQMILFRVFQGAFGAGMSPMSQAIMLDLVPPNKRGQIMGVWGMGIMLGPIMGPPLGGWLTDAMSWHWVFFVNVPVGILSTALIWFFFRDAPADKELRFDWMGFAFIALALGAFQLMMDRGGEKDWFSSTEIIMEAVIAGLCLYLFAVHVLTSKSSLIPIDLFKDRNFITGAMMMFILGGSMMASSVLLPPFLQRLGGYTVLDTGLLMMPRGVGTAMMMAFTGRLAMRYDGRILMTIGTLVTIWSLWEMSNWSPAVDVYWLSLVTALQGAATSLMFMPMTVYAFSTLAPELRTDASALMNLSRNIGSGIAVSISTVYLTAMTQEWHSAMSSFATPFNRDLGSMNVSTSFGAARMDQVISFEALANAYSEDFLFLALLMTPLLIFTWSMSKPDTARYFGTPTPAQLKKEEL